MNDQQADTFVVVAMAIVAVFAVALLVSGCSTQPYPVQKMTLKLPGKRAMMGVTDQAALASDPTAPTLTIFSQQQGILAMVCGAVVQYANGEPASMISGNCDTPLGLVAGSPINIGLAAALIPLLK